MDELEYQEHLESFQKLISEYDARQIFEEVISIAIQEAVHLHGHKADVAAQAVLNTLEAFEI